MAPPSWAFEYSPSVADGGGTWATAGASALAILTVAAAVCWAVLHAAIVKFNRRKGANDPTVQLYSGGRSSPLRLTAASFYALCRDFSRLGAILLISFVCEHYPIFPHASKQQDMDLFWFLTAALFLGAALTMRNSKTTDLLHREQTEEWKGWMQYMFLLYHYLSAAKVYNAIRVMITCYVWLTGYGNFSFFYMKGDFGSVRVLQMLWRLNFLVLLLMLVQGNTYILYYICPLHTFYFLVTYVCMRVGKGMNRTKWAIRVKVFVCAVLIFLVWDTNLGLFDLLFAWVGKEPVMGGVAGTEYEWYFRTSLDHYSTILGMVFALNYPVSNAFFAQAGRMAPARKYAVLGFGCLCALGILGYWLLEYYSLGKLDYNATNAYMAPVALLSYVFLRNAFPEFRARHSYLLHDIGKTTLETYLLQHHIWLTSNAKTLLVLVPGMPKVNLLVTSCMYVQFAQECHRVTMSLRGMFLPDGNVYACVRNLILLAILFASVLGIGEVLAAAQLTRAWLLTIVFFLGVVIAVCVLTFLDALRRGMGPRAVPEFVFFLPCFAVLGAFLIALLSVWGPSVDRPIVDGATCVDAVQTGAWVYRRQLNTIDCLGANGVDQDHRLVQGWMALEQQTASCETLAWQWRSERGAASGCGFRMVDQKTAKARVPVDLRVAVVGDSEGRKMYHGLRRLFFGDAGEAFAHHSDLTPLEAGLEGRQIGFYWAPMIEDVRRIVAELYASAARPHAIVISAALWDALHNRDLDAYTRTARTVADEVAGRSDVVYVFVQPPRIIDGLLNTEEKRQFMTERIVATYRHVHDIEFRDEMDLLIKLDHLTGEAFSSEHTTDGVHYAPIYYDVAVQQIVNALPYAAEERGLGWELPSFDSRGTGAMQNPAYGLGVLVAIAVMLVTFDSFGGYTLLGAAVCGSKELKKSMTYAEAFGSVLNAAQAGPPSPALVEPGTEVPDSSEKVPLMEPDRTV